MSRMLRVAVVVSHPIQHFCPRYLSWAKLPNVDLKVFFASDYGLSTYGDAGFDRDVKWDLRARFSTRVPARREGKPRDKPDRCAGRR